MTFLITLIAFFLVFFALFLIESKMEKERTTVYVDAMYSDDDIDIVEALTMLHDKYPRWCNEYHAIDRALNYLEHSIMRDYSTAFMIIEKAFRKKEVKELHKRLLEKEKNKVIYLLTC